MEIVNCCNNCGATIEHGDFCSRECFDAFYEEHPHLVTVEAS